MNITELDSYNLADAVKFNDHLNPAIWAGNKMKPEVRERLLTIAQDFKEFLGLSDLEVKDITVSGSNAGYTYTPHSDIDLHLVVDIPQADASEVYRELFDAKKYQYNDLHNIKIGGYDVELYVEDARKQPVSQGIYSVLNNDWVKIPLKRRATVDDEAVKSKFEDIGHRIEAAIASGNGDTINELASKIKNMRQAGLDEHGELGPENLAYKMLRSQGMIKKLYDARMAAQDRELSLNERKKKKVTKKKTKYGFGGYWYPGYSFDNGTDASAADAGGDGGGESIRESAPTAEQTVVDFVTFCVEQLGIEQTPRIQFKRDPAWSERNKTFGSYNHNTNLLTVSLANRHVMDILRTVAHELTHQRQGEVADVPDHAGETGSKWENEANAKAGVLMREYGQAHPDLFAESPVEEGWKQNVAAGILGAGLALGGSARADNVQQPTQQVQIQKNQLVKKHFDTLVQRAQATGQPLDTRTLNKFRAIANDKAQTEINQQQSQTPVKSPGQFPSQGSETRRSADFNKFEEVDEGIKQKLGAVAAVACIAGTPGCATTTAGAVKDAQTVARTAQTVKGLTKQGVKAELDQELKNFVKAQVQGPGSANAKNQSRLYQLQKKVQQNEASGYIPTKKQARLPQFSNALSVDVHPGQIGKEANKMQLHTDSQGHPELLIKGLKNALREFKETGSLDKPTSTVEALAKKYNVTKSQVQTELSKGIKVEREHTSDIDTACEIALDHLSERLDYYTQLAKIDEVRMAPSNLKQFADSPEAEGIVAGFEAEMIFRDAQGDDDSDDYEADYDADERAYSIGQVVEFFENDDYGYGLSPRRADRLRNDLDERYYEWWDEQMYSAFRDEQDDLIRDLLLEDKPMTERVHDALTHGHDYSDEEADKIIAAGGKAPRFTRLDDQEIYAEEHPDYESYLKATEDAETILDEEVEASIDNQDSTYDAALENFRDSFQVDDSDFFTDVGLRWMSSIASEYDLDWPIMSGSNSGSGERSWDGIAESLSEVLGKRVVVGGGYHQIKRGDYYVLEPDGSLSPDDPNDEVGLEIVSPPMPLNQAIEQLNKVIEWADNEGDAYTNSSTGLHMGISVPYKGGNVDYVKLALFLGDEHVLEQFGRSANSYCDSAVKKLRQNVSGSKNRGDDKIASAMELMKSNLIELAQKYVQQGVGDAKYTSIHVKPGYIEFRSPGGDYLRASNKEIGILENTMRRFAYAMYLAGRPDLERPEYYKKLYKLIAPKGDDALNLFAQFASGEIDQEQLKKEWAEKTLAKEVEPEKPGQWVLYNRATGERVQGQEYGNYKETDAVERAKAKISPASSMEDFLKAYKMVDMSVPQVWKIFNSETGEIYDLFKAKTRGEAMDRLHDNFVGRPGYENLDLALDLDAEPDDEITPPKKLSRRAELAKKIAQPGDYVIINKHSGLPFYTFRATSQNSAVSLAIEYLNSKGLDLGNFTVQSAANARQAKDNARDSRQLQQRVQTVPGMARYEIVDRRTGESKLEFVAADPETAGYAFNNWLRNQGMPLDTENYGYRPVQELDPGAEQRAQNIRDSAPRADFEVYDSSDNDRVVSTLSNATAERVRELIQSYESPSGGYAPGVLRVRQVNESIDDAQRARAAMDAAAKKLGDANFSAVPQSAKNTVMQMAVNALKLDNSHYNMLDRKNK